jgi:hypothetical protein
VLYPAIAAALAALVPLVVFCFKKRNHLHELSRLRHFRH